MVNEMKNKCEHKEQTKINDTMSVCNTCGVLLEKGEEYAQFAGNWEDGEAKACLGIEDPHPKTF